MNGKWRYLLIFIFCFFLCGTNSILADDMDDEIDKYTDDGIDKYDELGKADKNVKFIVLDAKSRANVRARSGKELATDAQGGNMNSVILGPGGNVRGDIIIIDQSKGDKTQVVE